MDASPLRIVLVPWLGFGHLLPYLELAERLASRGHHVSYVSTPRNLARLPPPVSPRVHLVALPFPRVDGLPADAESTHDVADKDRHLHWQAFDALAAPFAAFLAAACVGQATTKPDWIVADFYLHWAGASAAEHRVPFAMLLPSGAAVVAQLSGPSGLAEAPRFERERNAELFSNSAASAVMSRMERYRLTQERCAVAAIRSCVEWEPEMFPLLAPLVCKPVVPLGLLPPPSPDAASREHATVRWLDAQPPSSVLYVALGSEVPLRVEQVREMALGLELAGTRFLWALRKPPGGDAADADDMLPPGFRERTHGQGMVTTGWVPQTSILAHGAVGGFLTHCGQSSLIEGLMFGHPLVMLPISGDQGPNARQMEKKKVGLQVARDEKDGSFDRHGVATAVKAVMLEGETRRCFVAGATKMQQVVADKGRHERYIDEFVQQLRSYTPAAET